MMLLLFILAMGALVLSLQAGSRTRELQSQLEASDERRRLLEARLERLERDRGMVGGEVSGVVAGRGLEADRVEGGSGGVVSGGVTGRPPVWEEAVVSAAGARLVTEPPPLGEPRSEPRPEPEPLPIPALPAGAGVVGSAGARLGGWDWEQFMGVRLFAWLGGLALFLAVAYFVKYSFDRNLIPPSVRVMLGLGMGAGLVLGGLRFRTETYRVTAQTLAGTGVVVLYASLFGGHALYDLPWLGSGVTFVLMTLVTALAFVMAARMPALVVAVLGMLGGFLTPLLLSEGRDQPGVLFAYLAFLNLGLVAVALARGWSFLPAAGGTLTVLFELGWFGRFFSPERWGLAFVIFAGFVALFLGGLWVARRREDAEKLGWWAIAVGVVAFGMLMAAGWMLGMRGLGGEPLKVFAFVVVADLALLAVAWWMARWVGLHAAAGLVAFGYLAAWMATVMTGEQLGVALFLSLVFAVLHAGYPLVLARFKPGARQAPLAQVFPAVALSVLLIPMLKLEAPSFAVWPVILLVDLLALALAAWGAGVVGAVVALGLSGLATSMWIGRMTGDAAGLGGTLLVVVGTAVLFAGAAMGLVRRRGLTPGDTQASGEEALLSQLPVLSGFMPFLLLAQLTMHVALPDPTPVFAVGAVMAALLLGLTLWLRHGWLPWLALAGLTLVEWVWWVDEGRAVPAPIGAVLWVAGLHLAQLGCPLVFRERMDRLGLPWMAAAVSGVPAWGIVHPMVKHAWELEWPGLVPLAFAVPVGAVLAWLVRSLAPDHPDRVRRLAWFGGVTLFFLTVALPVQFERHVLTVGWALEGAALLWLFGRVPHPGLRATGVGLLIAVFVRLILNPDAVDGVTRGAWPLWNVWLYTYGVGVAAMYAGAWWLKEGRDRVLGSRTRPLLVVMGTVLLFGLVNLQIAHSFTLVGDVVRFEFTGHFGRDMTYTIAWALFALGLVVAGLSRGVAPARWSGLGLLAVAVAKLFLHDLARLDHLYRIGALAGVAVVAITASMLYQRFVAREGAPAGTKSWWRWWLAGGGPGH